MGKETKEKSVGGLLIQDELKQQIYKGLSEWKSADHVQGVEYGIEKTVEILSRGGGYSELEYRSKLIKAGGEIALLEARLMHRHIIGKVYDVTAESINKIAGELDEVKQENKDLKKQLAELEKSYREFQEAF